MPRRFEFRAETASTKPSFQCQLESQQCEAETKAGRRCKNKTVIGIPYCWIHLKWQKHLEIKPSTIANAGKGLFSTQAIPKNKRIIGYEGEILTKQQLEKRYGKKTAPYALQVNNNRYIDGACVRSVGSMINHQPSRKSNARFGNPRYGKVSVIAKKPIAAHSEIVVSYGPRYRFTEGTSSKTK